MGFRRIGSIYPCTRLVGMNPPNPRSGFGLIHHPQASTREGWSLVCLASLTSLPHMEDDMAMALPNDDDDMLMDSDGDQESDGR